MNKRTPILVGSAQYVDRCPANRDSKSPTEISSYVSEKALVDATKNNDFKLTIDVVAVARLFEHSIKDAVMWPNPFGSPDNLPKAIAKRVGLNPKRLIYAEVGGETPQRLVNQMAEKIFLGEAESVLLTGSEALATIRSAKKSGIEFDWQEEVGGDFEDQWPDEIMADDYERRHGITYPIQVYALLEQARRNRLGLNLSDYRKIIANLLKPFTDVAEKNPYAQFPKSLKKEFIANFSDENFPLCEPYSKWMVAQDAVNQGAAVVMTSIGNAMKHGIPEDQWIFLKSYADCDELRVIQRPDISRSPAQKTALLHALDYSGLAIKDITYFDLYSCFPIAVWTACEYLELKTDGSVPLTVTGGLPYFGGAGNNYSLHSIAEVVQRLRRRKKESALVAANGGYLSKHSVGVYSNVFQGEWRPSSKLFGTDLKRCPVPVTETFQGQGQVETYAAIYSRGNPEKGFIVGRSEREKKRFLAVVDSQNSKTIDFLFKENPIGEIVNVSHRSGLNFFSIN